MSKAKNAYLKLWRKRNKKHMQAYDRARQPINTLRKRARRKLEKKLGKSRLRGRDVHHVSGNAANNSVSNLKVAKRYHGFSGKRGYKKKRRR